MRFEDFVDQELEQGRDLLWKMKALEVNLFFINFSSSYVARPVVAIKEQ